MKRINVCVPTRGKAEYLVKYVTQSIENSTLPGTKFVIGFDEDDPTWRAALDSLPMSPKIIASAEPREDSVGAKFNRCAAVYKADLYVMGVDDVGLVTPGWDEQLVNTASLFTDGIGLVYMGREPHGEPFPSMQCATKKFVELMGYFVNPYFPSFWWCNTWLDEIGQLTGRILSVSVKTVYPPVMPATRKRDLAFWAWFFEVTRPLRLDTANTIKAAQDDPLWYQEKRIELMPGLLEGFRSRGTALRDPANARRILQLDRPSVQYVPDPNDAEEDARHQRLTMQALRVVESMAV